MKHYKTRLALLVALSIGNALAAFGQSTIYEQSRFGPNNSNGSNNPDFTYGSAISATLSSIKSSAPGLPGNSSSCRFFSSPGTVNSTFTVTPSGANQLSVGTTYAIATTFGNNATSGQTETPTMTVLNSDTGTTGRDTFAGSSTAFQSGNGVNTWETIGYVTINSTTPTFTFTWSSGFTADRWYVDTVRFVPLGTQGTAQYWDISGAIGGTGAWDTTSTNWNPNVNGSGTPAAYSPSGLAIFAGTAGTVTIEANGITNSGGLEFDTTGYTVSGGPLTLGSSYSIWVTNGAQVNISSSIAGTNGLVLAAPGTVAVSSPFNALTGTVNLAAGTLNLSSTSPQSFTSLTGAGSLVLADTTLTIGSDGSNTTFSGVISDAGAGASIVKTGSGILTLTGANTFTGTVTINQGELAAPNATALGAIPSSQNPAQITLNGNGATLFSTSTGTLTLNVNQGITLNGSNVITANSSQREITFNCPITGNGSLTMPCVWPDFNAVNTFTGDLIFQLTNNVSARLNVNNCAGMGRIHIMPMTSSGTPITLRNLAPTGANTTITNNIFFDESVSHAQSYNIDTAGGSGAFTLTGNISGAATGGVNVGDNSNGGGIVTLSGNNSGFSGGFNLEGGTLMLGSSSALGSGAFVINHAGLPSQTLEAGLPLTNSSALTNTVYLNTTTGFAINGANPIQFAGPFNVGTGTSTIDVENLLTIISGTISDGGLGYGLTLTSGSASTLLVTGSNALSGGFIVDGGTIEAAGTNSVNGATVNGGTLQFDDIAAMTPTGSLTVNSGVVNLNFTGYMTNAELTVGGTPQPYGIYGAGAGGSNPDSVFTGTGYLVVSPNFAITSAALDSTGTNLVVCWESTVGYNYNVLTNFNLPFPSLPSSWSPINSSPIAASNTITCYTLPGITNDHQVFVLIRATFTAP